MFALLVWVFGFICWLALFGFVVIGWFFCLSGFDYLRAGGLCFDGFAFVCLLICVLFLLGLCF